MERRTYLRGVATLSIAGIAGCLGSSGATANVVLAEPDRQFESSDVPYPAWGEQLPDVTVPAPLEDRDVSVRAVGDPTVMTFFYSMCPSVCPLLISSVGQVQSHALENGYGDAVAFLPVTFDPARDDAGRLREYAGEMNVDAEAGNWHFLRPASEARAKDVVQEQFGVAFRKGSPEASSGTNATGRADDTAGADDTDDTGHDDHDHGAYEFTHSALTLLVNGDAYVERAYRTQSPDPNAIVDDLATVRNA